MSLPACATFCVGMMTPDHRVACTKNTYASRDAFATEPALIARSVPLAAWLLDGSSKGLFLVGRLANGIGRLAPKGGRIWSGHASIE